MCRYARISAVSSYGECVGVNASMVDKGGNDNHQVNVQIRSNQADGLWSSVAACALRMKLGDLAPGQ